MSKLTLAMIVKNEAGRLARCLTSAREIVDEITLVDTGSTDETKKIAQSFGARILDFAWSNDFSAARNFALNSSDGDWNLMLDGDEYITNDCKKEIREFIESQPAIGRVKLVDKFIQDEEEKFSKCYLSRLIPKGTFYAGIIHEQLVSPLPRVIVPVELGHDGYVGVSKEDRNLKLLLKALETAPDDPYMLYQTGTQYHLAKQYDLAEQYLARDYSVIPLSESYRPSLVVRYLYNIIGKGNLAKGLEIINAEQVNLADYTDFHFVSALLYMELAFKDQRYLNLFPLIEKEYQKCLELGEDEQHDGVIGAGSFYAMYNLGVFYEVSGRVQTAKGYYSQAANCGYQKAEDHLKALGILGK